MRVYIRYGDKPLTVQSHQVNSHKDMISKVFLNLNPGGWAEFFDWGCETIGADAAAEERLQRSSWAKWVDYLVAGGTAIGRDFTAARKYKQ